MAKRSRVRRRWKGLRSYRPHFWAQYEGESLPPRCYSTVMLLRGRFGFLPLGIDRASMTLAAKSMHWIVWPTGGCTRGNVSRFNSAMTPTPPPSATRPSNVRISDAESSEAIRVLPANAGDVGAAGTPPGILQALIRDRSVDGDEIVMLIFTHGRKSWALAAPRPIALHR